MYELFEGFEFDAQVGAADEGDAQQYKIGALYGINFDNDKGNFDRVSTLKIAMFYMKENEDKPVKDKKPVSSHLAQLNSFYNDGTVQHSFPTP